MAEYRYRLLYKARGFRTSFRTFDASGRSVTSQGDRPEVLLLLGINSAGHRLEPL